MYENYMLGTKKQAGSNHHSFHQSFPESMFFKDLNGKACNGNVFLAVKFMCAFTRIVCLWHHFLCAKRFPATGFGRPSVREAVSRLIPARPFLLILDELHDAGLSTVRFAKLTLVHKLSFPPRFFFLLSLRFRTLQNYFR
jgi:hypothetical protein